MLAAPARRRLAPPCPPCWSVATPRRAQDHRTNLTDQTDLTAKFSTFGLAQTLVAGTEFSRERDNTVRFVNPFGDPGETPATPLLAPNPYEISPTEPGRTRGVTTAYGSAAYIIDTLHLGPLFDVTGGVRYDRFAAHYRPSALIAGVRPASLVPLDHTDHIWSPRASLVFKPTEHQRYYFSYGTSFDPSAEALSLNSRTASLAPVIAKSYELGAKLDWLGGKLSTTAALFRTQIDNAQVTDPDHPTQLVLAGNERVDGLELGRHRSADLEMGNHRGLYLSEWQDDRLQRGGEMSASNWPIPPKTPSTCGPNTSSPTISNWASAAIISASVTPTTRKLRFLPSYVIVDAMAAWTIDRHLTLRVNVNNVFNTLAWQNAYYSDPQENHVIPSPGRTALFTAAVKY